MLILCIIWTIGMLVMWTQAHFTMALRGRAEVAGEYKAVLELAAALNTHLLQPEEETKSGALLALPEKVLRRRVTQDTRGGSMAYEQSLQTGDAWREISKVLRKEVWWILSILGSLGAVFLFSVMNLAFPWVFAGASAALTLPVFIGTSGRSRAVILVWAFPLLCLIPLVVSFPLWYLPPG
jgi:hypothetical protein